MKRIIALLAFAAVTVMAQSSPSFTFSQGTDPVTMKVCTSAQNVGSIYTTITNPSVTYVCQQTGSTSLGAGAYQWVSISNSASATAIKATTISATGQITSTLADGTAPMVVTSTTPVANLTAQVLAYNAAGTQQTNAHAVFGTCTLGTNCAVTLTGSAAFTSSSSYYCSGTDQTAAAAVKVVNTSASVVTFTGTGTDVIAYVCIGR